jgi:predicted phage terminase large subunit-like protein
MATATAEQTKEAARRRKANQRAREKGMPEPYPVINFAAEDEEKGLKEQEHLENLSWAQSLDAGGRFYKSECRPAVTLLAIYEGNNYVGFEDPDEIDPKTGRKKQNIPNPWKQSIKIRAIEKVTDGISIKIDPDMLEYKHLFEVNHRVSFREWLDLRHKGRCNLFWLSGVLGKRLFHNTHQMICDKFVQKDFDGLYFPEFERSDLNEMIRRQKRFAADGTPTRTALLFAPRSGWKSTIDGVDAVQWLLNCPDIRIMIITAFRPLAKQFLGEIKRYFYLPPRGTPSAFQLLYPEYVLTGVDGRSGEPMRCSAATMDSKEPHLWITSMESSATGMRCDIRKADDIVDPKNSADEELRQKLESNFNGTNDLTEPWGFTDIIGTRYFTDDYYGTRMKPDDDGLVAPFSFLSISAWTPKSEFKAKYETLLDLPNGMSQVTEEMVDLWFPSKLSFQVLRDMLLAKKERNSTNVQKERSFRNQQLNIATDPTEVNELAVHFEKEVLRTHTYGAAAAPVTGETVVTIDWAYSENKGSDFSVLAASRVHTREDQTKELIILDIDYDKWKASDLASHIVLFLRTHRPKVTLIEKSNGHDLLLMALIAYANKYGCVDVLSTIRWVETGNTPNAKTNRIKCLEILLTDDRLHFVAGSWIDELYRQFERFTGETKKGRKDDIPDAISQATRFLPSGMFTASRIDPEEEKRSRDEYERKQLRQMQYDRMYSGVPNSQRNNQPPTIHAPTWRQYARGERGDVTKPPEPVEQEPPKPQDPRMAIFGNKGPWRL